MEEYLNNLNDVLSTGNIAVLTAYWKQAAFQGKNGQIVRAVINSKVQEIADINQLTPYHLQFCYETEPEEWTDFTSLVDAYDNRYVQQTLQNGDYNQLLQYISQVKGSRIPLLVLKNLCWTYISEDETLFTLILQVLLRTYNHPEFAVSWLGILDYFFSGENQAEIDLLLEEREGLTDSLLAWNWVLYGVAISLLNSLQSEQTQELLSKVYVVERDSGLSENINSITFSNEDEQIFDTIALQALEQVADTVKEGRLMNEHRNLTYKIYYLVHNGYKESLSFILEHSQEIDLLENLAVSMVKNSKPLRRQEILDLPWNSVFFREAQLEIEDVYAQYLAKNQDQQIKEISDAVEQRIEDYKNSL